MKLKILESNCINERLQRLGNDMFITDYAGDIVNLLVNKPKAYRFLYDAQADLYMICDAWDYIHNDMIEQAFKEGWYESQKKFIKWLQSHLSKRYITYFLSGIVRWKIGDVTEDELELIGDGVKRDDSYIYPWIYCFGFVPNDSDEDDDAAFRDDGYKNSYKLSFGTVYTKNFGLSKCREMKTALNRADQTGNYNT